MGGSGGPCARVMTLSEGRGTTSGGGGVTRPCIFCTNASAASFSSVASLALLSRLATLATSSAFEACSFCSWIWAICSLVWASYLSNYPCSAQVNSFCWRRAYTCPSSACSRAFACTAAACSCCAALKAACVCSRRWCAWVVSCSLAVICPCNCSSRVLRPVALSMACWAVFSATYCWIMACSCSCCSLAACSAISRCCRAASSAARSATASLVAQACSFPFTPASRARA